MGCYLHLNQKLKQKQKHKPSAVFRSISAYVCFQTFLLGFMLCYVMPYTNYPCQQVYEERQSDSFFFSNHKSTNSMLEYVHLNWLYNLIQTLRKKIVRTQVARRAYDSLSCVYGHAYLEMK